MIITILIVLATLVALMALHEFGHFLFAKKFGVKVEEFGIGMPPRIFGKKYGETIYSINLLPIGAFVKLLGEEEKSDDPRSFNKKKIWQRALILAGGVVSFWIIAYLILIPVLAVWGAPSSIPEDLTTGFINPRVQIMAVVSKSPAEKAGIQAGDTIKAIQSANSNKQSLTKAQDFQNFVAENKGQEITLTLLRGKKEIQVKAIPRIDAPEDEGALGVVLARVGDIKYPWFRTPIKSAEIVGRQTIEIPKSIAEIISQLLAGKKVPGAEVSGPIGIGKIMARALDQNVGSFLSFLAMISIWLALFNLLPIPALDGGQLLFLGIEAIRKKPLPNQIQQKITAGFFFALIIIMVLVTIKDVIGLF